MPNYLELIYDQKKRFNMNYDNQLVHYLITKFSLKPGKFLDIGYGTQTMMKLFKEKGNLTIYKKL